MADDVSEHAPPLLPALPADNDVSEQRRLRVGDEDEEKTSEADDRHADARTVSKAQYKERERADVGDDAGSVPRWEESVATSSQDNAKRRTSPSAVVTDAIGMRSPSRRATSLLGGRGRVARAARAWREGARRAGLFGGEDDDEDYEDDDDDEGEEKRGDWGDNQLHDNGGAVLELKLPGVASPLERGSDDVLVEPTQERRPSWSVLMEGRDENPAVNELEESIQSLILAPRSSVPRLVPLPLAPATRLPKMAPLWMFLDRIECIVIQDVYTTQDDDDSGPTVHYVLDVYNYQEQHSLPTRRYHAAPLSTARRVPVTVVSSSSSTLPPPPSRKPDYHISHRFSSFTKLRTRVFKATQRKHPQGSTQSDAQSSSSSSHRHCAYCQRVALFLATGSDSVAPLGWRTKFFTTVEMRTTLLSQFISELVFLAREQRDTCSNLVTLTRLSQPPSRHVHRSVPGILRRFLTVQTGENFMR